jgi:hypothetical protein
LVGSVSRYQNHAAVGRRQTDTQSCRSGPTDRTPE